jgi:3-deoxy-7-phosphoheptulonate synthase
MNSKENWEINSWRNYPALQQPNWPDISHYNQILGEISKLPALVFAGETRSLKDDLSNALEGNAFILQCGDCSESFERCNGPKIHSLLKVILQMSIIIAYAGEKRVVNIGRLAGQYAKPRSSDEETINNNTIPVYRGDMVNSPEPTVEARIPDPNRILEGYFRATATLNLIRAFTIGGYASINQVEDWHRDFFLNFKENKKYLKLIEDIQKAVSFLESFGVDSRSPHLNQMSLYTSHEALLLGYEESLTRIDTTTGDWYDTSAHMLWIGDRTRQLDGAHVEFLRGVRNPIGIKIGPNHNIDELKKLFIKLNPNNESGRLTFITRFGVNNIIKYLPELLKEMKTEGFQIVWCCDPMHGNTYKNNMSIKTRRVEDVLQEIRHFFDVHKDLESIASGVHLELTGDLVTECTGGTSKLYDHDLNRNYQSTCDPRLNAEQAIEIAFEIAEIINPRT